jgi:hypothetical protein
MWIRWSQIEGKHRDEVSLLNPILEELANEGRIRMTIGKYGDLVSLTGK